MWLFLFLVGGLAVGAFYWQAREHQKETALRHVRHLSEAVHALVNMELHEQLHSEDQMGGDLHLKALLPLVEFHRGVPSIHYIYTMRVDEEGNEFFVLDTAFDPDLRAREDMILSKIMQPYRNEVSTPEVHAAMLRGETFVYPEVYEDRYGSFIAAQSPLFDHQGRYVGYAGVDYRLSAYHAQLAEVRNAAWFALLVAAILAGIVAAILRQAQVDNLENIRELEHINTALLKARNAAESAAHEKTELLGIAAHELKNPLNAIHTIGQLLQQDTKVFGAKRVWKEQDHEWVGVIHDSAHQMARLVDDLLERQIRPGTHVRGNSIDLSELVEDLIRFNRPSALRKDIDIESEVSSGIYVRGNLLHLREALDNLISNAIKFSPHGKSIRIVLESSREGSEAVFRVFDRGPGIHPDEAKHLFQPLTTLSAKPTGGELSTGLGLSIVKQVVDAHDGMVGMDPAIIGGACFWIRLARIQNPEPAEEADPERAQT